MMRTVVRLVLTVTMLAGLGLAGCNTMEGFGEDMKKTGEAIEDEAEG